MPVNAPAKLLHDAEVLEGALRPILERLGAERVEIIARGSPGYVKYWVGYRLAPGVQRTQREMNDPVVMNFPAALSYTQLTIVPIEQLPETDPSVLAAQAAIRRPPWTTMVSFGLLAVVVVGFFMGPLLFGRGGLIATAQLRAKGTAEARFVSSGKPVALWAALDGSWSGKPGSASSKTLRKILPVHYEIDFIQNDKVVRHLSLDTHVQRGAQKLYCTMAPDCEIYLDDVPSIAAGPVLLRVQGTPRDDVTRVDDMSLNVREDTFF